MSARERDVLKAVIAALKTGDRAHLISFANMLHIHGAKWRSTPKLAAIVIAKLIEGEI